MDIHNIGPKRIVVSAFMSVFLVTILFQGTGNAFFKKPWDHFETDYLKEVVTSDLSYFDGAWYGMLSCPPTTGDSGFDASRNFTIKNGKGEYERSASATRIYKRWKIKIKDTGKVNINGTYYSDKLKRIHFYGQIGIDSDDYNREVMWVKGTRGPRTCECIMSRAVPLMAKKALANKVPLYADFFRQKEKEKTQRLTKFDIPKKNFDVILLPNSSTDVSINIKNIGKYNARNIKAELPVTNGNGIKYHLQGDGFIGDILSGKSKNITLSINSNSDINSDSATIPLKIVDSYGHIHSQFVTINYTSELVRGLPPNLFAELIFRDENGNGILEALESAELEVSITNKGKGRAQGLEVSVEDDLNDPELNSTSKVVAFLEPDDSRTITISLKAGVHIKTAEHKLRISVREYFGYDMDPAFLILNTYEYQPPKFILSGMEIDDSSGDVAAIIEDGQLQAGELVNLKIVVQNIGQGVANKVNYSINSKDKNIYIENDSGYFEVVNPGEIKEFWVKVSPNKRVKTKKQLPLFLSVSENLGKGNLTEYQLPIYLNQKLPEKNILAVKPDINSLKIKFARFEHKSNKFKIRKGDIIDIKTIKASKLNKKDSIGVVIGIEKYEELPSAPYAKNDAKLMEDYFKKRLGVEQVVTYINDEMSGFKFDDIFNPNYGELQRAIIKGQTDLFVYYSGHGVPNKSGTEIYLFPSDGKVASLEKRGFSINKLFDYLNKLEAKSVTVILDACFSGGSKKSETIKTNNIVAMKGLKLKIEKPWLWYNNFTVINSSTAEETSLAYDESESGLFTYYLCAGLQGKADTNNDNKITLGELKSYVTTRVIDTSKKISGLQTPEFFGDNESVLVNY